MAKIFLYLLGAGASSQVLPMSVTFTDRLFKFAAELKDSDIRTDSGTMHPTLEVAREELYKAINWVAIESSRHYSVDTFAKKLFFLGQIEELKKLKAVLSTYLTIEQAKNHVDKRYDAFFASILKFDDSRRIILPDQLRILTWNYDTQLERAFHGFCEDDQIAIERITNNDKIYRINGYCSTKPILKIRGEYSITLKYEKGTIWLNAINIYNTFMDERLPIAIDINFAWEDHTLAEFKRSWLISDLRDVTDLIVIGYSFPYFNREIDAIIFRNLSSLSRVYLQYPIGNHTTITERIKKFLPLNINPIPIEGIDLFFIPDDF